MRILTATAPTNWRDLQDQVGLVLDECGFDVEVEKTVSTARGTVELDILAEETVQGRRYSIACECKHWRRRVGQSVIHAFRTVVADLGLNLGYIISTSEFQAGALPAAELTNIRLYTWQAFQDTFCETWLEKHFVPMVTRELDPLFSYTEPLVPSWLLEVSEADKQVLRDLREKHLPLGRLAMSFTSYARFATQTPFRQLPLRESLGSSMRDLSELPAPVLDATGYRDLLQVILQLGKDAIAEFREIKLRAGCGRADAKLPNRKSR